jgi:plastocyanin
VITLFLGAVGVASLLAAAPLEFIRAGEAAVTAAASAATVQIDNFAFAPATLTVTAGTTVTWKNDDDSPHRIGDKKGTFTSAALDTDDAFSHTFAAPGGVRVYLHDPSVHGWNDHRQTRREIIVIGGPIRHDTLSKTRLRSN